MGNQSHPSSRSAADANSQSAEANRFSTDLILDLADATGDHTGLQGVGDLTNLVFETTDRNYDGINDAAALHGSTDNTLSGIAIDSVDANGKMALTTTSPEVSAIAAVQSLSSSSSSSTSAVDEQGAGSQSSANAISPSGETSSSEQSTYVPGAEASGGSASAIASSAGAQTNTSTSTPTISSDELNGDFDAGAYIASHDDLITAFGYDLAAGRNHYLQYGRDEGRQITFEADDYIASYGDLIRAFGYDLVKGAEHYIRFGSTEQRTRDLFDEITYLNKYPDLQNAFGADAEAATKHFIQYGFEEGRTV